MQGCKTILLKLKVAEKKKKISLTILTTKAGFCLLNLLWQEGFIYGYKRYGLKVVVFLKSFFTCLGFFSKVVFYEKTMSWKDIKVITLFNLNVFFIVFTPYGVFSNTFCIKRKLGGSVLCHL